MHLYACVHANDQYFRYLGLLPAVAQLDN